jgi:adenine-specific DNA-methyltransferase
VGARIGIYNPRGEKVGQVGHVRNRERIYVCSERKLDLAALTEDAAPRVSRA